MGDNEKAVLKTLLYSDIFDFPLTLEEIHKFLHSGKTVDKNTLAKSIQHLDLFLSEKDGYYSLKGRVELIHKRKNGQTELEKKRAYAKRYSKLLFFIPSIVFIGVSGGVAIGDVEENDDIDLFVITKNNTVWITRILCLLILQIVGVRRKRSAKATRDMICVNMFLEESSMQFSGHRQNIYTAHEIVQLLPLFQRMRAYQRFVSENSWIRSFLANWKPGNGLQTNTNSLFEQVATTLLRFFNGLAQIIQKYFINRHRTTEEIADSFLAFHPKDYTKKILAAYKTRIQHFSKQYNIHL